MARLTAKDIMHPRVSVPAKENGQELIKKLMCGYPALPVVNDRLEVIGTVSEYDILDAIKEGRTMHEFSAESIMSCGHAAHEQEVCRSPLTVQPGASIDEVVDIMYTEDVSVVPVVEGKKLVGIISRKNIINAMTEKDFWPEEDFRKRT
ncbi:MAG: CBS domain-containing protein [Nitrospiraceae bacterium]|nr:MAG: CBS domain-containing protein [Nitrospiraceae bacterium]